MSKRKNQPNRCDPRQVGLRNAAEYMVKSSIIGALKMYVERYGEQLTEQREQSRTCSGSAESRRKKNEVQLTEQDINAFGLDEGREGEEKLPLRRRRGRGAFCSSARIWAAMSSTVPTAATASSWESPSSIRSSIISL